MAAPRKKRRHTPPPEEQGDMKTGRFYCRKIEWWDNYSDEDLELMQRRGKQLREGGYGAVERDDLIGTK